MAFVNSPQAYSQAGEDTGPEAHKAGLYVVIAYEREAVSANWYEQPVSLQRSHRPYRSIVCYGVVAVGDKAGLIANVVN